MPKYECGLATQAIQFLESGKANNFAYAVRLSLPQRGESYPRAELNALLNRVRNVAARRKGCRELVLQASPHFIQRRFAKAEQRAAKRREKIRPVPCAHIAILRTRLKPGIEVEADENPYLFSPKQLVLHF